MVRGHLPGLFDLKEAVIEGRLALEKVEDIGPAAFALAADIREAGCALEAVICPDKTVRILIFLCLLALKEPGVFFRGMSGNQIKQNTDPLFVRFIEETKQIFIGAVTRGHFFIVPNVITCIFEW